MNRNKSSRKKQRRLSSEERQYKIEFLEPLCEFLNIKITQVATGQFELGNPTSQIEKLLLMLAGPNWGPPSDQNTVDKNSLIKLRKKLMSKVSAIEGRGRRNVRLEGARFYLEEAHVGDQYGFAVNTDDFCSRVEINFGFTFDGLQISKAVAKCKAQDCQKWFVKFKSQRSTKTYCLPKCSGRFRKQKSRKKHELSESTRRKRSAKP